MSEKKKETGGSAFPTRLEMDGNGNIHLWAEAGMTLRDWFAGQALPQVRHMLPGDAAQAAYAMADAMLKERAR